MISISKRVMDSANGNVILNELDTSDIITKTARVSRTATLDGGVYINHFGFTDGDRTLKIDAKVNKSQSAILDSIYNTQFFIVVSIFDGVYIGAIEQYKNDNGILNLVILIKERVSI